MSIPFLAFLSYGRFEVFTDYNQIENQSELETSSLL